MPASTISAIGAVKLGMLANADDDRRGRAMRSSTTSRRSSCSIRSWWRPAARGCWSRDALDALRARLLPLATIVTPNIPEAELLLGHPVEDDAAADAAVAELLALGHAGDAC